MRNFLIFAAVMTGTPFLIANPVSVTINDRKEAYLPGEEISVELKGPDGATAQWQFSRDGEEPIHKGEATLFNGAAKVSGTLSNPGFLRFSVSYGAEKTQPLLAAVAFSPLEIRSTQSEPEDFLSFWKEKAKTAVKKIQETKATPLEGKDSAVVSFDIEVPTDDVPLRGILSRPANAAPRSLPAILTLHAAGFRSASQEVSEKWAKEGMLALDLNAHGLANGESEDFYKAEAARRAAYYHQGAHSREESYFLPMFLRVVQALEVLSSQPEWDGKALITYGYSQGGAQAIVGAALDPRVTLVVAGVPAMCEHSGLLYGQPTGWPRWVRREADGTPRSDDASAARYFDMSNFARHVKAKAIFTVGFIDTACPPTTVYSTWNALPGKKEMIDCPLIGHGVPSSVQQQLKEAVLLHGK